MKRTALVNSAKLDCASICTFKKCKNNQHIPGTHKVTSSLMYQVSFIHIQDIVQNLYSRKWQLRCGRGEIWRVKNILNNIISENFDIVMTYFCSVKYFCMIYVLFCTVNITCIMINLNHSLITEYLRANDDIKSEQGLYSLSVKTSYRVISWTLEAMRLDVIMIVWW